MLDSTRIGAEPHKHYVSRDAPNNGTWTSLQNAARASLRVYPFPLSFLGLFHLEVKVFLILSQGNASDFTTSKLDATPKTTRTERYGKEVPHHFLYMCDSFFCTCKKS